MGAERAQTAVQWLSDSEEPAIRLLARRDLLGEDAPRDRYAILDGPMVRSLLAGQQADGGFGGHPYRKWSGAHWRLVSLVELEVPGGEPRAVAAADRVLRWLTVGGTRTRTEPRGDPPRSDASIEGNAVATCTRLGLASDPRVRVLVDGLIAWQWPDGGWNCDPSATGRRSSFHETHATMWGLHEYATATGDAAAAQAARRAAELLLEHRLYRSGGVGDAIHPSWVVLHYPAYWHYDVLQGLVLLSRMGLAGDPRAADALDIIEARRLPDGRWRPGAYWWSPPGSGRPTPEVVDWGRGGPSEMLTLNALRVLKAAGRWRPRPA
jgi:hypothetical protein